jgi:uncharacterized membrane protein
MPMRWLNVLQTAPLVLYPLLFYFASEHVETRYLGIALVALLALRYRHHVLRFMSGLEWIGSVLVVLALLFGAAVWWTNDERWLRFYPVFMNAIALMSFTVTLVRPPSMVERFARLQHDSLSPAAIIYTRRVTWVWCGFFVINGLIAAYSALFLSRMAWALYNGFICYLLMGGLWLGEWLVRGRWMGQEQRG